MIKELKYVFYVAVILIFLFLVFKYYFSDDHKKKFFRSLNNIDNKILNYSNDLIILNNDTSNVVEYVEYQKNINKKKYHFWKLLNND
tara:strand:+ start:1583 stop:1843 length:261 start_codon:yes stop_codon:yes gene_type:complete